MKKGVVHWHVFAVFAVVAIGCLVLSMKAQSIGQSFRPMIEPVDRGLATYFEEQEQARQEFRDNNQFVGDTPSASKAIAGTVLAIGALALLIIGLMRKDEKKKVLKHQARHDLISLLEEVEKNKAKLVRKRKR